MESPGAEKVVYGTVLLLQHAQDLDVLYFVMSMRNGSTVLTI